VLLLWVNTEGIEIEVGVVDFDKKQQKMAEWTIVVAVVDHNIEKEVLAHSTNDWMLGIDLHLYYYSLLALDHLDIYYN